MQFFDLLEKYAAYALLMLMAIIVFSATLEVAYVIATDMFKPPGFFIGVRDLFELFGFIILALTVGYYLIRRTRSD